ncbi:hypothetical protein [Piscinibacter sp. XHJ-5]|uniref:hypothetical protein n=1 Tax=Piscinibacter sp. XHJ-5 TaxID=3037797 RepID=UPI0024529712|nr:hypothetical protein [Piscinibacter sp. XHJ-5]
MAVYRVSAKAIGIESLAAVIAKPDPSATTWSRLEPLPTSDDVSEALQARVADPLWMLARQWQFNEFQGEDAGSPIKAGLRIEGVPVTSLVGGDAPAQALAGAAPVEALVEREQVLAAHPKLNAQAGQQLMRQLRAAGAGGALAALLDRYPAAIVAPDDPAADNAGFVWNALLNGKAVDALAVAADLRPLIGNDAGLDAFGSGLGLGAAQLAAFRGAATRWVAWLDDFALEGGTPGPSPYWNPQRLEYAFSLQADGTAPLLKLDADEYADGRLDWHTFTVNADAAQAGPGVQLIEVEPKRPPMPAIARYPGMPADRYWEFEDGRVSFGMLGAAKNDLARLAVIEYALVFGNDWFTLPVTLPVNALYRVARLDVLDNFGITVKIPPATNPDGTQWTMYEMSVGTSALAPRPRLNDILYLCPAVKALEGAPLEHVLMMRDEMANMVWGIEKRVQGTSGEPLDRKFESHRLSTSQQLRPPPDAVPAADGAPLHYTLQTPVAAHWIPFLPVKKAGATPAQWAIQLQRGVVTHHYQVTPLRLNDPRNADYKAFIERLRAAPFVEQKPEQGPPDNRLQGFMFHPRGAILRLDPNAPVDGDYLRIAEEEVPRDGIEVKRAFNYARDAQGKALLWIGRRKTTGRGEGSSGLRFDVIRRGRA